MWATTTILMICGLRFSVAINDGFYRCETSFDDKTCLVQVVCNTGKAKPIVPRSGFVENYKEKIVLEGCNRQAPQSRSLYVMGEFVASISCIREGVDPFTMLPIDPASR